MLTWYTNGRALDSLAGAIQAAEHTPGALIEMRHDGQLSAVIALDMARDVLQFTAEHAPSTAQLQAGLFDEYDDD